MKNYSEDDQLIHLTSRIKFLEKSYSNLFILTTKFSLLKPQDFISQNRVLPLKETLKTLPKPEFSFDDQKLLQINNFDSTKQVLREKLDPSIFPEIQSIFENFYIQTLNYIQGTLSEKSSFTKSPPKPVDRAIKYTEKKINTFQREARRPSIEKSNGSRDVTPKKPPQKNLSVSPSDKKVHYMSQENQDLREQLKKLAEERDLLKAWKENILKAPASLSEDCNSIIKQQELFIKQLIISNKLLISKVQALVNSVLRFIKDTSNFQKILREKEGFLSLNLYETEKCKIKVKLKELAEVKDIQVFLVDLPFLTQNGNFDFSQFTEKYLGIESENKTLKIQLRDAQKKLKKVECRTPDKAFYVSERSSPEKMEKIDREKMEKPEKNLGNDYVKVKNFAIKRIDEMKKEFFLVFEKLSIKIEEKEKVLAEYRTKFMESLKKNFKSVVELKDSLKLSINDSPNTEILTNQIKSLEFLIDQNKYYKEVEIQELTQEIELLEKQKFKQNEEIFELKKEKNEILLKLSQFNKIEQQLCESQALVEELEGKNLALSKKIRELKQREVEFNENLYEKRILESEIQKLLSEIENKQQEIEELQKTMSLEQIKNGSCVDELLLKENTAKKELELVKIELSTYKMQISVLENINEDLEKKVKSLESSY